MHWELNADAQLMMLVASLAAGCAIAGLLVCEFVGSRWAVRFVPGILGGLFGAIAAGSLVMRQPAWLTLGCAIFAALLGSASALRMEFMQSLLAKYLRPKAVWAVLLGLSVLWSRLLAVSVLSSVGAESPPAILDLADVPVLTTQAVTDKGRGIGLFHFKMHSTAEDIQGFIEQNEREHVQLIRLLAANPASNCHGWVFVGGRYGVRDPEVSLILADHDYVEVTQPGEGDLAIYRRDEQICHSGLVRLLHKQAPVLVESKWGPLGVYLHAVAAHPFGGECRFYRSARSGHTLAARPAASARPTAAIVAPGTTVE